MLPYSTHMMTPTVRIFVDYMTETFDNYMLTKQTLAADGEQENTGKFSRIQQNI